MRTTYDATLQAHLSIDDDNIVRQIRHSQEPWLGEEDVPRLSAVEYLQSVAGTFGIQQDQVRRLHHRVSYLDPHEQGVEYQLSEVKRVFDSTTVGYYQTYLNVPVWRAGVSVQLKENPTRVVGSTNNSEYDLRGKLPDPQVVERYRAMLESVQRRKGEPALGEEEAAPEPLVSVVQNALGLAAKKGRSRAAEVAALREGRIAVLNGRFFIYRYSSQRRYAGQPSPPDPQTRAPEADLEAHDPPFLPLPPVLDQINEGQAYLVAEIIFSLNMPTVGEMVWLILVELETGAILYAEPMTLGVDGLVFRQDPMVATGDLTITADQANAALNPHRSSQVLNNLDAAVGGTQNLRGTYVRIQDLKIPNTNPPTQPGGSNFDYNARTDEFAAVNAYYHQTELFRVIESLGFPIENYFDGTTFPIPVDHRGMGNETNMGNLINAHWSPNGAGGTHHMCYALGDLSDTSNPLGRAVDPWVHWHEMGGHGTLGDHVESGTFGFAHSAGDGLAAIQIDPDSALRALPDRFRYAPFRPALNRRFDRPVATWAWGGTNDNGGYGSEQILATCHFRIYRSIGGDHSNLNRRRFASRVTTYLILRTIGSLTPGTNPSNWNPATMTTVPGRGAQLWCEAMMAIDLENWTTQGLFGGAYNKVIRWAFEQQGSYQTPPAPSPVTTVGAPPQVDVYIDDGRGGEYPFQAVHWHNTSMWNRNAPDGLSGHQNAIEGQTNYMYVTVKNRGTSAATGVTVKGYHCLPGAGLTWPVDFVQMQPLAGLPVASIGPNSSEEVTVGPFEWIPNFNAYGHDCVLMIASAPGDASNIDHFTVGETIEEWRLVPNDNNVGQRNVSIVPGGGGETGLMRGLNRHVFFAGNTFRRRAKMELKAELPGFLAAAGWRLRFEGLADNTFTLRSGEKRQIVIQLDPGTNFTADQVRNAVDRDIAVVLFANDMPLGGMTYRLDPELKEPSGGPRRPGTCNDKAAELLKCLDLGGAKVKNVCVKKVSLDVELENDCGKCD
jgi:zinc metalloprotease ZmpB